MSTDSTVDTIHVYRDHAGQWRWNFKAPNGRILADSGEGYEHKSDCEESMRRVVVVGDDPDDRTEYVIVLDAS